MRKIVLAVLAAFAFGRAALAQNYPSHPITVIVPFSAGGPSDAMMRILAERMKLSLGEAMLIENVTGRAARSASAARYDRPPTVTPSVSATSAPTSPTARSTSLAMISSPIWSRWCCCRATP